MKNYRNNNILLSAHHSVIEPLGLLHLAGVAKQEGWNPKIHLIKDPDFIDLEQEIKRFDPSLVGFSIYTGNHQSIFNFSDHLMKTRKDIETILGGPHATYSPTESSYHANYVVLSQAFNSFRNILRGKAQHGILPLEEIEKFPPSERHQFYNDHPKHKESKIKSIITQTGCPYQCSYCYNSSKFDSIELHIPADKKEKMRTALGSSGRLFPKMQRSVNEVIHEVHDVLNISPETNRIYFQDDIFGTDLRRLEEFSKKYSKIGVPFHAQMRFEYLDPQKDHGKKRMNLLKESGCDGLTFAIESAIPTIREELLHRRMNQDIMFNVFENISKLGFRARTEQMIGLPYGATKTPTPIGLEADLETLKLNVQLKEATGLPTIAWSSTFAPYIGTDLGKYCLDHGFYSGNGKDIPVSFFKKSVLYHLKKWVGPQLTKDTRGAWENEEEGIIHQTQLSILQNLFSTWASIPQGHILAKDFLEKNGSTFEELSNSTRRHLYDNVLYSIKK